MLRLRTAKPFSWRVGWATTCLLFAACAGCHSINFLALRPPPAVPNVFRAAFVGTVIGVDPSAVTTADVGALTSVETIDLTVALRLAGVDNPTINLAEEQIREALAGRLAARSLLLPSINVGANYRLHHGALQDDPGFLRILNSQSMYLGGGAGAIGAGTIAVPGVWLFAHLGDAVYEPLAAKQRLAVRQSDAQGTRNAVLLDVAIAYLELAGAQARLAVIRQAEGEVNEIVRITSGFAKAGQGAPSDANRAVANSALIRRQANEAEGAITSASARLARLLSLDPSARLRTPGGPLEVIRLAGEDADLESLVTTAVQNRPELFARGAAIEEAQTRVRQERIRPWLPLVAIGYSGGFFGGGSNKVPDNFSPLDGRSDLTLMAVWNVQNLGFGNHARTRQADAVVGQAVAGYDGALNQIRREVAEAQAASKTAARQINVAKSALTTAEEGFQLENERIRQGQGRPIEALDSFSQLLDARQELVRAVIAFDIAQFQLYVALGNNPTSGW